MLSFDGSDTTADVIIISRDNIRFHAHKLILSLASPFFKDMFALAYTRSIKDYP
ncbi:hypothetical protein DFS33DRAFT_1352350 [Desarmillaria ectypa]|nr:hypothetical protein DFS33DRAFT_1352350 [Desarmillaria ectypa]